MVKVLHILGGSLNSGAGKEVKILNEKINEETKSVSSIFNEKNNFGNFIEKSLKRFYLKRQSTSFSLNLLGNNFLKNQIYKNSDIINLHWINASLIKINDINKIKKPIVWTLYDMWPITGGCHYSLGCEKYKKLCGSCPQLGSNLSFDLSRVLLKKKIISFIDKNITFVSPSKWLTRKLQNVEILKGNKVINLYGTFNEKNFSVLDKIKSRTDLSIKTKKKIVLFGAVNVVAKYKGFNFFINSLKYLDKNEYFILLVGNFWNISEIEKTKFEFKHLGYVKDEKLMNKIYSASDVFVTPSLEDAFHKMSIESMLSGTPCVYFENTCIDERNEHKITGYKARYLQDGDLANGIRFLSKNKEALGIKAREKILKIYDQKKLINFYENLYKEILKKNKI